MRLSEAGNAQRRSWLARDWLWAVGLFLVCLALYWPTLAPSVVSDDSAEFQMLAPVLGVSHPTGYPLYLLLGWVAAHLPLGGDVAFRLNLLTMFSAAAAMAFFFLLLRELDVQRGVAFLSTLLLASMPSLWLTSVAAEVYPLAVLFMALGSWLLLRWGRGKTPLWAAALAFGFALTHHVSIRLFAPAVLVYLLAVEPRLPLRPRRWMPAAIAVLLPLALYAYVPLRAGHFESLALWQGEVAGIPKSVASGYISPSYTLGGPASYFLATGQSGSVLSGWSISQSVLAQAVDLSGQQYPLWAVLPVALAGLVALLFRRTRAGLYLLLAFAVTAWAVLRYLDVQGRGTAQLLPLQVIVVAWFAVGASSAVGWLLSRMRPGSRPGLLQGTALLLLAVVPAANIVRGYPEALAQHRADARSEALAFLAQPLPEGAVIAGPWSDITPLRYLQRIEGIRRDLWVVHADDRGIAEVLYPAARAEGTPFYVLRATGAGLRLLPLPPLSGVVPAHGDGESLEGLVSLEGYDLEGGPVAPGEALPLTLYWKLESPIDGEWKVFIHLLDAQGNRVAQIDRAPLAGLYPLAQWQAGELLADQYEIPLSADVAPGTYTLIIGWYDAAGRLLWEDGQDSHSLAEIEVLP